MIEKIEKLTLKKAIDYIKFFLAILFLYLGFWAWKSYDVILIPIDNAQMSPSFFPKEFHVGKRFENHENVDYGMVVYYTQAHPVAKRTDNSFFFARVVGLPGDTISIKRGVLHRNGKSVDEPYVAHENFLEENYEEVIVPREHVYLLVDNRKRLNREVYYQDSRAWGPFFVYTLNGILTQK